MCGIAGCILKEGLVAPKLYEALKRLEYRGYDSVGIATIYNNQLLIKKDAGKIEEVNARLKLKNLNGSIGLAHCLHPDTLIMLADGEIKKIKDLPKTVKLIVYDFKKKRFTKALGRVYKHKADKLLRIRTLSADILSTDYHKYYVFDEESEKIIEKPAYMLKEGDLLIFPQKVEIEGKSKPLSSIDKTVYYKPTEEGWDLLDKIIRDPKNKDKLSSGYVDHIKARDRNVSSKVFKRLGIKPDENLFKPVNSRTNYVEFPNTTTPELMRFLGYLYGDGYIGERYIRFKDRERKILEEYRRIIRKIFSLDSKIIRGYGDYYVLKVDSIYLVKWLRKNFPALVVNKEIPGWIGGLTSEEVYAFIGGLYDAEGFVGLRSRIVGMTVSSSDDMKKVQMFLLRAGILASISYGKLDDTHKNVPVRLQIANKEYIGRFIKTVGRFISRPKLTNVVKIYSVMKGIAFEHIKVPLRKRIIREKIGYRSFLKGDGYLTLYTIQKYRDGELDEYIDEYIKEYLTSPVVYQRIKSIEEIEYDGYVYDIEVDEYHNFIANAMIQHNSRWATHGGPTKENAHPHTDCKDSIAVVHNGVIENFQELKNELMDLGHVFRSRTDTEVIPHLIEEEMDKGLDLYNSVVNAVKRIKGSYALGIISTRESDKIICVRNESPLIIGIGEDGMYCASDIPAILPYTNKVIPLRNGEIAVLTKDSYVIYRLRDGKQVTREPTIIDWSIEAAAKQGYPHFMLKEIHEQPESLRNALRLQEKYLDLISLFLDRGKKIFIVGAGTSYHAGLAASYMFSRLAKVHVDPVIASEFIENYGEAVDIDTVILAVSQSGETYDTLKAVEHARMRAATIIGITNTLGSTLTRVARAYILQQAGPEIGVAATKTFTSQLTVLAQIALRLSKMRGKVSQDEIDEFTEELWRIPDIVDEVIKRSEDKIKALAKKYRDKNLFLFLGRGINTATAYEGRLKLLEISYIPSLAFSAGESVTYETPIMILEGDEIKVRPIGEVADKFFRNDEEGVKEVDELYTLGIDSDYRVKPRRIRAVARHKVDKVYRIRYEGGFIRATEDHSVFIYTPNGIEAKPVRDLKPGDILVTFHKSSMGFIDGDPIIDAKEYYWDEYAKETWRMYNEAFRLHEKGLTYAEIARKLGITSKKVKGWIKEGRTPWVIKNMGEPDKIKVTPELMKLFGYYLAEGCVWKTERKKRRRKVPEYSMSFSFNVKEKDKIDFVVRTMKKYFNVKPSGITHPEPTETCIIYHRKRVSLFFKNLFGSDAYSKRIPSFFYILSRRHIESFIEGYSSDGHLDKKGGLTIFTVNKELATSIIWLLKIHGINQFLMRKKLKERKINGSTIKSKSKYLYAIGFSKSEDILLKNRPHYSTVSKRLPANLLKKIYELVDIVSNGKATPSRIRSIASYNKLISIERGRRLIEELLDKNRSVTINVMDNDVVKLFYSDLGSSRVIEVVEEDYNGYVYDLCGADNEAFFGGIYPILLHNSKHGPIAVVEKGVPVIFIAPRDKTRRDIIGNIMEMKARGAEIISLCEEGDEEIIELSDDVIEMPKGIPELLTPIPYVVPLQLFAYYMAVERGLDPDKPRNLAKSVTVP